MRWPNGRSIKVNASKAALLGEGGLLTKITRTVLERALEAETSEHLGCERGDPAGHESGNSRNGTSPKTVLTDAGAVTLAVPQHRNGDFEPLLFTKNARRSARSTPRRPPAAPARRPGEQHHVTQRSEAGLWTAPYADPRRAGPAARGRHTASPADGPSPAPSAPIPAAVAGSGSRTGSPGKGSTGFRDGCLGPPATTACCCPGVQCQRATAPSAANAAVAVVIVAAKATAPDLMQAW
ncbi:transposase [Streptomyces goshikiensis]|uniref:transposase n=1 Tax=Streptomyces goshikiensis TaxID=1942 RepID=UPI0036511470